MVSYVPPGLPSGQNSVNPPSGGSGYQLNADSNPDELAQLQPLAISNSTSSGGAITFPGILFREEQSNSLAVHMYPNLPSANVENMGRDPAKFHVKAILTNNVYPGPNEMWVPGKLFPQTFNQLVNLLVDPAIKVLTHPVYGKISCMVHTWDYELNPKGPRDGAIVNINLIETIGPNNPLGQQLAASPGSGLANAANSLDDAIENAPDDISPPGLSLGQMFGQINALVRQAVAFPSSVVTQLNASIITPITNGLGSIGGALITAPSTTVALNQTAIQQTKQSILNATVSIQNAVFQAEASNSPNPLNPLGLNLNPSPSYDASTYQAMQSIIALNNTPSQNAYQLINKVMRALVDLQQHYINQNNSAASPIIEAIRQMLLQLQQTQSTLSLNTNNQSVQVVTYLTTTNITWQQLSLYLNNSVDQLMGLNQGLVNDFWIPQNTTINYYQG